MERGNAINSCEIQVLDFDRQKKFTKQSPIIKGGKINWDLPEWGFLYSIFTIKNHARHPFTIRNCGYLYQTGTLVLLNCQPNLAVVPDKIGTADERILRSKREIYFEHKPLLYVDKDAE